MPEFRLCPGRSVGILVTVAILRPFVVLSQVVPRPRPICDVLAEGTEALSHQDSHSSFGRSYFDKLTFNREIKISDVRPALAYETETLHPPSPSHRASDCTISCVTFS